MKKFIKYGYFSTALHTHIAEVIFQKKIFCGLIYILNQFPEGHKIISKKDKNETGYWKHIKMS